MNTICHDAHLRSRLGRNARHRTDRDPARVEHQARVIANALRLMRVARELIEFAQDNPHETPNQLSDLARQAEMLMAAIYHEAKPKMDAPAAAAE